MLVESNAVAGPCEPPPDTVAVLITFAGAVGDTFTVTVIGGYPKVGARLWLVVHVAVPTVQAHTPAPPSDIPVSVRPVGRVSVTVTWPLVEVVALLTTEMLYCAPV